MAKNTPRPPEDRDKVARWLATPKRLRSPRTQAHLAAQMGISPSTISKWRARHNLDRRASEIHGEINDPNRLMKLRVELMKYTREA